MSNNIRIDTLTAGAQTRGRNPCSEPAARLRDDPSLEFVPTTRALTYTPARYAMNRTAKTPSIIPKAVIASVRFTGPKKINVTMTIFSMIEAVKIGGRVAGKYALYIR